MLAHASLSCKRKRSMCLSLQLLRAALTQFPFLDITRPPPIGKLVVRSAERLILQRAAAEWLLRMGLGDYDIAMLVSHCGARSAVRRNHAAAAAVTRCSASRRLDAVRASCARTSEQRTPRWRCGWSWHASRSIRFHTRSSAQLRSLPHRLA